MHLSQLKFGVCNVRKAFFPLRQGSSISVILLKELTNRGVEGELIKVKRGFARNFLIPRKIAKYVTSENRRKMEPEAANVGDNISQEDKWTALKNKLIEEKNIKLNAISKTTFEFERLSNKEGTMFGSVTAANIKKGLVRAGLRAEVNILLPQAIKTFGNHKVQVDGVDISINIKPLVVAVEESDF